jgi:hypothetical protein
MDQCRRLSITVEKKECKKASEKNLDTELTKPRIRRQRIIIKHGKRKIINRRPICLLTFFAYGQ